MVKSVKELETGDKIILILSDGNVDAQIV